jgi:hypothetical protein
MAQKGRKNIQATKTRVEGIIFDSKFEAEYYLLLKMREKVGEIAGLRTHVTLPLSNKLVSIRELRGQKVRSYTPDFFFLEKDEDGEFTKGVVVDTKGITTPVASLRLSVFKALYPQLELRIEKQAKRRGWKRKKKT